LNFAKKAKRRFWLKIVYAALAQTLLNNTGMNGDLYCRQEKSLIIPFSLTIVEIRWFSENAGLPAAKYTRWRL
jgi:hypothetical protein